MASFITTVRQMNELFQWPKCLTKKWPKCFCEKKTGREPQFGNHRLSSSGTDFHYLSLKDQWGSAP